MPQHRESIPVLYCIVLHRAVLHCRLHCIVLPEYIGWVSPQLAAHKVIGVVALRHRDLHELGNVESKGEHSDRQKVNEEAEGRTQCLQVKDILEKRCG